VFVPHLRRSRERKEGFMSDAIRRMQEGLRGSSSPVSAFFLIDSESAARRMADKLGCLAAYGVTADQVRAISELVADLMRQFRPEDEFEQRYKLSFAAGNEPRIGLFQIRNAPGRGFEVELILPGIVAATADGFLDDGFWCAFMPPSFYD
jgi:hypothetical protein